MAVKRVAIIILNWNGLDDTLECLSSLSELEYKNYQIIVVDNNSTEDISTLPEQYPGVILIRNHDNYGFCKGNNIGIEKAVELKYDYCWILNNDTVVAKDCLGKLVDALSQDESIAAVTNRVDYYQDHSLSWFAGGIFLNGIPAIRGFFEKINDNHEQEDTEYLVGCSFLARTDILNKVGGFDENYFCYVEDVDISMKIRELGWKIIYSKDAVVWHKVSASTGIHSPLKLYYKHRNMLYFLRKFNNPINPSVRWYLSSFRYILSLLVKHRNPKAAWYLFRGLVDGTKGRMGKLASY